MRSVHFRLGSAALLIACVAVTAEAQSIMAPFNADYSFVDLGSVPGVPANFGGVAISSDNPNVLFIGGAANSPGAAVYRINLTRDIDGNITGFQGTAVLVASAPRIDGGLCFGPGGVMCFTTYSDNQFGQILEGSTSPNRMIPLSPLGVTASTGTVQFIPAGFPGAGRLIFGSYNASRWYTADPVPAGDGTFTLSNVTFRSFTGGGPEGIVFVPAGSPLITFPSALVSEYGNGVIAVYAVDSEGAPVPASRQVFMSGLSGAEGACIDPFTGQFLFSTFGGGNRVIVVRGLARAILCNAADMANTDGTPGADGNLDNGDFFLFISSFFTGCEVPGTIPCGLADIAGTSGSSNPDGAIDNGDFILFISLFFQGCTP
jgi:hypothetical protein